MHSVGLQDMTGEIRNIAIAIIGKVGVGKTSIVRLLDESVKSPGTTYVVSTKDTIYTFWELQTSSYEPTKLEVFSSSFLRGSAPFDRFLLITTDSTREDVDEIKYSLRFLRESFPDTRFAIIANKQDFADRLSASRIEKMTNLPTLETSAIDISQRNRLVNFISYLIGSDSGL
jgi:signal recognition particle receptor subunit beta